MKAAKEEWIEEQCKNIEKEMTSGNSKEAYNTLRAHNETNSISQQSLKTAVEIFRRKERLL